MKIYLCVGWDRHIDDEYAAFYKLPDAIKWCEEWMEDTNHEFTEPDWSWQGLYSYYMTAGDDLPKVHIEMIELN